MEKAEECGIKIVFAFVDIRKAFDAVDHDFLYTSVKTQDVYLKYIRLIKGR